MSLTARSQTTIQKYVQTQAVAVKSIQPTDTSYADLEAFGKAIAGKRVVMLGEQDHGDAPAFMAKTRLIRYLHEQHGFNVLAFESDFFSLTEGLQEVRDTSTLKQYLQQNIFPIWTQCDAASYLFYQYLPQQFNKQTPILVTGFDSQLHGQYTRQNLHQYLDTALQEQKFQVKNFNNIKQLLLIHADSLMYSYGRTFNNKAYFETMILQLELLMQHQTKQQTNPYLTVLLKSLKANSIQTMARFESSTSESSRDAGMAANLDWLVNETYKHEKIIVWAANGHILKNSQSVVGKNFFRSMGDFFCSTPENRTQTYVLGFASRDGMAGRLFYKGAFKVTDPLPYSFENWLQQFPFAFIDFTPYNQMQKKKEAFHLKGIDHYWNGLGKWSTAFDGIFYIRTMEACQAIN